MRTAATFCISLLLILGDPTGGSAQERRGTFEFKQLPLRLALDSLMARFSVAIIYLDEDVRGKDVSASCGDCDLDGALRIVLGAASLDWVRTGNQLILRHRVDEPREPRVTVAGVVTDSVTGSGIGDAMVLLRDGGQQRVRWCTANGYGFYSLRGIPPGDYTLTIRALGYRPVTIRVPVDGESNIRQDVSILPQEITLPEVTIEALRTSTAPAEGYARGVFIRSAPSDHYQYQVDGVRIYNPAHFGETISTFSGEALNDVEVTLGALPPNYGGRIGGMLDLSMREGARDRLRGAAGIGSLGSAVSLEGPAGGASSFLVSMRRGFADPWVPSLGEHGDRAHSGTGEVLAKASAVMSASSRLALFGYWGQDSYVNGSGSGSASLGNGFSWGNLAAGLRWFGIASPSTFIVASASFSRYHLALLHEANSFAEVQRSAYAIGDLCLRGHAEQYYDDAHTFRGGVELIRHEITGTISPFSTRQAAMTFDGSAIWEFSLYLQDQWEIVNDLRVDLGGRVTMFTGSTGTFSAVDPRVSMRLALDDRTALTASLSGVHEFLHPYRYSGVFLLCPTTFWFPSTDSAGPTTAFQMTLGFLRDLAGVDFAVATYYRHAADLHGTMPAESSFGPSPILSGTGRSYGVSVSLRRRFGNPRGSIEYILSRTDQSFDRIGGGAAMRSPFDRRHEIQAQLAYEPAAGWTVGCVAVIATGDPRVSSAAFTGVAGGRDAGQAAMAEFLDINGSRSPGFERLEVSLQKVLLLGDTQVRLTMSLMNGYGILDPFRWGATGSQDPRLAWYATVDEIPLFPLYPTLNMNIRF